MVDDAQYYTSCCPLVNGHSHRAYLADIQEPVGQRVQAFVNGFNAKASPIEVKSQGLVTVPFWEYWTSPEIVAI